MRRHTAIITAVVAVAVLLLVAVAGLLAGREPDDAARAPSPEPEPGPEPRSEVVAGVTGHPGPLDPHTNAAADGPVVLEQVYDTLVRPGPDLRVQPALAEAWEVSDDQLTWTFRLRDDVTFHDGTALVSGDVIASLRRVREHGQEAERIDVIRQARAPDLYTVEIELHHPAADLPARLASSPRLAVVPAAAVADDEVDTPLPGTGPFRPRRDVDDHGTVVLEPVGSHWEHTPALDRLVFAVVGDRATGLEALHDGRIHWLASVAAADADDVAQDDALELGRTVGTDHWHLALDTRRAPLDDPAVRRALATALDREAVVAAVRSGAATVNQTAIPPSSWWHHGYAPFDHDPDDARQRLEAAGATPLELELLATDDVPESAAIAEEVAAQLGEIDVEVTVRTVGFEDLLRAAAAGEFDAYALGWSGGIDPDEVYWPTHHGDGERNYHGLDDDDIDGLLEDAREQPDEEARAEIYAEAVERIVDQAGQLDLYNPHRLRAWSAGLAGVTLRPDGLTRFDVVTLDEPGPAASRRLRRNRR